MLQFLKVRFIGLMCLSQTKKASEVFTVTLTGLDKVTGAGRD